MKTLLAMAVGTATLLDAGVALAQNGYMMNGGTGGNGWMNGWAGGAMWIWAVIGVLVVALLVVVIGKLAKK